MRSESEAENSWQDIFEAFDLWVNNVLDVESWLEKATNLQDAVDRALNRQQLDGLLSMSTIAEIRYVCSLWIKLLSLISSYNIGSAFAKEELIHILLELLSLKQIKYDIIVRCLHNLI